MIGLASNKRKEVLVTAISTAALGVIDLASAISFFGLYGFSPSEVGVEIIGFAYPIILLVAAEFDYEQRGWALVLSLVLCGLSMTNSIITLREQLTFIARVENWALLGFSIVGALASLIAISRMMNSEIDSRNKVNKRS
jgi:hypothetical protein